MGADLPEKSLPQFGLSATLLERFLKMKGWSARSLSSRRRYLTIPDEQASEPIEVVLSQGGDAEARDISFALTTIAEYYQMEAVEIAAEVRGLAADVIRSRIPDEYVRHDSIELRLATEYIEKFKNLLAASASTVISGERNILRLRKEGIEFSEQCRFGHTFRGSFGFQVEAPVGLNDQPALVDSVEELPLGRKVVERISRGLASLAQAERQGSISPIVNDESGFSSNMCDIVADIISDIGIARLDFEMKYSPEWKIDAPSIGCRFSVTRSQVDILEEAARSLRVVEKPREQTIVGRIKRLETTGNPADLFEDRSRREIEMVWVSDEDRAVSVKLALNPEDYLLALEAHKNGKPVAAFGTLSKQGRSWKLDDIKSFSEV
jgi:hypothetical protein